MPWQCSKCQTEVTEDDLTCPKCETDKTSWTLIPDKTRTFTVSGRKVTLMRGTQAETLAADDPNQEGAAALVKVDAIPAVPKAVAAEAAARGHRPASRDLLRVRLHPRKQTDWTVKLAVEFETDEVAEHEFLARPTPTSTRPTTWTSRSCSCSARGTRSSSRGSTWSTWARRLTWATRRPWR